MIKNDLEILLKAVLDQTGIKKDLKSLQKTLNKNKIKITPTFDEKKIKKSLKSVEKLIAKSFNKTYKLKFKENNAFKSLNKDINKTHSTYNKFISDVNKKALKSSGDLADTLTDKLENAMSSFEKLINNAASMMKELDSINVSKNDKVGKSNAESDKSSDTSDKVNGLLETVGLKDVGRVKCYPLQNNMPTVM